MSGIGLVFAGGGGKGAYEIGVWKYLHELGLDQYVTVVSGTSVGALNATLFAGGTYEIAEKLWLNIKPETILSKREINKEEILKYFVNSLISSNIMMGSLGIMNAIIAEDIGKMFLNKLDNDYIFSRIGLVQLIKDGVNFKQLQNNSISCYATCFCFSNFRIKRFELSNFSDRDIVTILLASSAIPIIFPNEEFHGKKYYDGGIPKLGDNVPVKPIYDTGVEYIFVVHLNQNSSVNRGKYSNSKIVEITPSKDLGNALTGTLDFTSEGAKKEFVKAMRMQNRQFSL